MKTYSTLLFNGALHRFALALLPGLLCLNLLAACSKKSDDSPTPAPSGTVTWTNNGTTYTSTLSASAVQDSDTSLLITGSSADMKNIVSLRLRRIYKTGPGVYQLLKGSGLAANTNNIGVLTLNSTAVYNTLYGPTNPSNGAATVSQYDRTGQKVAGTFFFNAGGLANTPAAGGTQSVTNGSFSFTGFR